MFPHVFFPNSSDYVGQLESFATYFVGFLARPVGAAIFGHWGDRIGRKATLIITLLLMGLSTALIGVLPGAGSHRASLAPIAADPAAGRCRASPSAASGAARCCCPWSGATRSAAG